MAAIKNKTWARFALPTLRLLQRSGSATALHEKTRSRMTAATCGSGIAIRRRDPGFRFAHPGYLLVRLTHFNFTRISLSQFWP
jgi:hypothetical protein